MTPKKEKPLDVDIWMPVMVADMLSGEHTFAMNNRQFGAFMRMLLHAWKQRASLPDDRAKLAKYADEPDEWLFLTEEGRAVVDQFPVGEGGRRRCPWQAERYEEALANRTDARKRAQDAANARWDRERGQLILPDVLPEQSASNADALPQESPSPSSLPEPTESSRAALTAAVERWPDTKAWLGDSTSRRNVLDAVAVCVLSDHGERGLIMGFVPVINAAIQEHKAANVEKALLNWVATAKSRTLNSLRVYIAGAARNGRTVASIESAPSSPRRSAENRPARPSKLA